MRLNFIYSPIADISDRATPRFKTSIQLPDDANHLFGVEERILELGKQVGRLTIAHLHIQCKDLGINNKYIDNGVNILSNLYFYTVYRDVIALHFGGYDTLRHRQANTTFQIAYPLDPIKLDIPRSLLHTYTGRKRKNPSLSGNVRPLEGNWIKTQEQQDYINALTVIRDQLDVILNASPHINWQFSGFHPFWYDDRVRKALKKEQKRVGTLKEKAKLKGKKDPSKHGKGNRIGAIPGKFMGIQMRSQLEIRLAAELEKRAIPWIYEEERLGDGQYLVDFHLPEHKAWVEVKGKFEARDHYLLREVAEVLQERSEKLYVYTSGKPQIVTPDDFTKIPRKEFWALLENNS